MCILYGGVKILLSGLNLYIDDHRVTFQLRIGMVNALLFKDNKMYIGKL
uniref:Uncharacterized protein n=1 Tax=Anguilla anguilla TaxID=7936 RepID=A0A0E9U2R5_ANGAN